MRRALGRQRSGWPSTKNSGARRSIRCSVTWKKERTMATSLVGLGERTDEAVKLEIVRVIRASRQRVFDAWTRPETIRQWFTPGTMKVVDAGMDACVGGEWRLLMNGACVDDEHPDEKSGTLVTGRY